MAASSPSTAICSSRTASSLSDSIRISRLDRPIDAFVQIPGSKSITNRALLIAALADGVSDLSGVLFSDDTRYMASALQTLGLDIALDEQREMARVSGCGGSFPQPAADLYVGNSGTTMRFLVAALAVGHGVYTVDGNSRMRTRPIGPLLAALNTLGSSAHGLETPGCPPVRIQADGLAGGQCGIPGNLSSQYISAVLMAAPFAHRDVEITILGELVSVPYLEITS